MNSPAWIAMNLAAAMLSGAWHERALLRRTETYFNVSTKRSQRRLVRAVVRWWRKPYPPSREELQAFLLESTWFHSVAEPIHLSGRVMPAVLKPVAFRPSDTFASLDLPEITTRRDLADWLCLPIHQLDWFVDRKRLQRHTTVPVLQHYNYAFVERRSGPPRLIEAPKPQLKALQRKILRRILDAVPVHRCAHGFVKARSCVTAAAKHGGEEVVITLDLKDFFVTTRLARVHLLFRHLGYSSPIASDLTGLCANATPHQVFLRLPRGQRPDPVARAKYLARHLPQGAPTSPALANLAAFHLDCRLDGLAKTFGASYTRYADDMAFSGSDQLAGRVDRLLRGVSRIAADEGFAINVRKTRIMRRHTRQRITGIVVNRHVNIARDRYDELKAILHNSVRSGPRLQNRRDVADFRSHLGGRVAWIEHLNAQRGAKLRRIFDQIRWD